MTVSQENHVNDLIVLNNLLPTRADAVKNRQLLRETAKRLFAERGVSAVTMSEVAEAAGVGKGTLYRHFANKAELCEDLIDDDQRDLQNRTLERIRAGGDPRDHLSWFVGEGLAFVIRNEALLISGEIGVPIDHPAHLWWRLTIRGLLIQIQPGVDIEYAADLLYVMLDPRTIHYQRRRGWSQERILEGMRSIVSAIVEAR